MAVGGWRVGTSKGSSKGNNIAMEKVKKAGKIGYFTDVLAGYKNQADSRVRRRWANVPGPP